MKKIKLDSDTKRLLRISLVISAVIIPLIIGALVNWAVSDQVKDHWTTTTHFDPTTAGFLTGVQDDSWAVIIAQQDYDRLNTDAKRVVSKKVADEFWKIAQEKGYNKQQVYAWFEKTALEYAKYPIKEVPLTDNRLLTYRDLSSSHIPKTSKVTAIVSSLKNPSELKWLLIFIIAISIAVVLMSTILIGSFGFFASTKIPLFFKIVFASTFVIFAISCWVIKQGGKSQIMPYANFNVFTFQDNYVSAQGTWEGVTEKIASPINVAELKCYKDEGVCRESNAELAGEALMLSSTTWDIKSWDEKEVIVEEVGKCSSTKIIINYKDKAVTQIRTPLDPLPTDCFIKGGETFITRMVDGMTVAYPQLKKKW